MNSNKILVHTAFNEFKIRILNIKIYKNLCTITFFFTFWTHKVTRTCMIKQKHKKKARKIMQLEIDITFTTALLGTNFDLKHGWNIEIYKKELWRLSLLHNKLEKVMLPSKCHTRCYYSVNSVPNTWCLCILKTQCSRCYAMPIRTADKLTLCTRLSFDAISICITSRFFNWSELRLCAWLSRSKSDEDRNGRTEQSLWSSQRIFCLCICGRSFMARTGCQA